jgi:predicted DNA-binding transcriptional regulator AlpA
MKSVASAPIPSTPPTELPNLLTLGEVARILRRSVRAVRKLPDFPPPIVCGRRLLWDKQDVQAYLQAKRQEVRHAE